MSIEATDAESAAVAVAPRVALSDIEAAITARYDLNAYEIVRHLNCPVRDELKPMSVCILVMKNGFTVIGKSAPASPANFNADLGKKLAYEDCIRQLWPMMAFALRDKLHAERKD